MKQSKYAGFKDMPCSLRLAEILEEIKNDSAAHKVMGRIHKALAVFKALQNSGLDKILKKEALDLFHQQQADKLMLQMSFIKLDPDKWILVSTFALNTITALCRRAKHGEL